ncbi:MAG: glycoside hydrolase family 1 protein [Candidatus Omnitrophica bacterium]|nr:glycoside hydrolase family 1 protein [Candidatus Omnitrophota bacterium]
MEQTFEFPKDFLWGAATSSHQVEGGNINNDWWQWEQNGNFKERSGEACDHWNRFREDFALAKSLHHNVHRFSLEWSRIEPQEGRFSEESLLHYREVIESLKSNGIEPVITLHHFTLPLWLARKGGWLFNETPFLFARYVRKIVETVGEGICYWITLNEPVAYVFKSHLMGEWPPFEKSYEKALQALSHLLKGHVLAYNAIKEVNQELNRPSAQVGIAKHVLIFTPCSERSWKDRLSVRIRNLMFNHIFIKALIRGQIFYPGLFHIRLPKARTLDFIGLNYYTRDFVHNEGFRIPKIFGDICTLKHHREIGKRNFLSWEIYPQGLYQLVKEFSQYGLPLLVTENGVCIDHDEERYEFIISHLIQLAKAMKDGAKVFGYLYWSLLDNYEWGDGYAPRFGLIEVDYTIQSRKVRESARKFAEICKSGQIYGEGPS